MIADTIIFIASSIVALIAGILSAINFAIPDQFSTAILFYVAKLSYLEGMLPISRLLEVVGWWVLFTTYWYTVKVLLKVFSWFPWIGKKATPEL